MLVDEINYVKEFLLVEDKTNDKDGQLESNIVLKITGR